MKRMDVAMLLAAYDEGRLSVDNKLVLDNDSTSVWVEGTCVFEMHPADLLEQVLDLLGIPHEPA